MGVLNFSDENIAKVHEIIGFAESPENWYYMGYTPWVPGDRPEFVVDVDSFRCVYTHTVDRKLNHFRHLSISLRGMPDKLPHPVCTFTLATWFGFTGAMMDGEIAIHPSPNWDISHNESEGCIVLVQQRPQQAPN